jgi:hypothetical protein
MIKFLFLLVYFSVPSQQSVSITIWGISTSAAVSTAGIKVGFAYVFALQLFDFVLID